MTSRFCFAAIAPVRRPIRRPSGERMPSSVSKCCFAKISVGAMNALMYPFFAAYQISAAATSVLPLPTSPWTSLFIALPDCISLIASLTDRLCAFVGAKGRADQNSLRSQGFSLYPSALL